MNFREAVDELCVPLTHTDVADAMGVSLQAVRQARLGEDVTGFRPPPQGWQRVIIRLAEMRIRRYRKLIEQLKS